MSKIRDWRKTPEYRKWKYACRNRDNNQCVITGLKTHLQVHHINHATYFPEQRYDVDNGVTLNRYVHLLFHILMMKGYRKKCTEKDWKRFVRLFKYINKINELIDYANKKQ